jgi:uncharacterized protein involved in type VI secretion and phage assembly
MYLNEIFDPRLATGLGGRFYGVYPAVVVDLNDPEGQGRVRVRLPWSPDAGGGGYEAWARLAAMMAGANRGAWFIPDVEDEVLVSFEAGDPRRPYVLGGLWNGRDAPPEDMDGASANNLKVLRSRNGVKLTIDDSQGAEVMKLETPGGHMVTMSDSARSIEIADSNGNVVRLNSGGVAITAAARVSVEAGAVEVSAGSVTVNAGMSRFSGVVQCDTLISMSVISASYSPGAGNIW